MLKFILGRSGFGKTQHIIKDIKRLINKDINQKIIYIVPEQYSFESEKKVLDALSEKKAQHIEVLSFSRLTDFVFRKIGKNINNLVDDGVKNIIMYQALNSCVDNLEVYKRHMKSPQFLNLMLSTVKELKQGSISTQFLLEKSKNINDKLFRKKIEETALIVDVYNALLNKKFSDPLDNLTTISNILSENNILSGYTIYIDGFSGFTAQEKELIKHFIVQGEKVYISLCIDDALLNSQDDLFLENRNTYKYFKNLAKDNNIEVLEDIILNKPFRFNSEDIKNLEECTLRLYSPIYENKCENIELFECSDIYQEVEMVACKIRELTINNNYMYKDIAVVCRNIEANFKRTTDNLYYLCF